jgi:hypothetical protein
LSKLSIHGTRTQGFGINGTAEYVRYFSIRDFGVIGFSTGIYIQAGEHIGKCSSILSVLIHTNPY